MADALSENTSADDPYDVGYADGYRAGYQNTLNDTLGWLTDNGHQEAADAMRYLLTPEGRKEQTERLEALYRRLRELADA